MKNIFDEIDLLEQEISARQTREKNQLAQIKEYYRIGLTYTSNAIEGNSLTETETKIVLEEGITIGGRLLRDHLEAIGHSDAYDFLYECAKQKQLTEDDIKKLHHFFYYRIDEKNAGVYRQVKVYLSASKYPLPAPDKVPMLMKKFIAELATEGDERHPVEIAARAHKDLVFIHPFIDGNGRVARLLMNIILVAAGYPIAVIPPITRPDYIRTLEKAHEDDTEFIQFIARMVKETQKDYLRLFVD